VVAAVVLALASAQAAVPGAHDDLFTNLTFRHLSIEVPPAGVEALRSYAFQRETPRADRPEVLGTVREGTTLWTNVAIHLKGSLGSFRPVDAKPSFTLNFSKQAPAQEFHGLEKISLNNSAQDPTRLSERICRELYVRGGVPVPRATHVTVEWNGRPLGVYVLLEGWDRRFVGRHFSDVTGPLYEGPLLTDIDQPLELAFGDPLENRFGTAALLAAAREPDPGRRWSLLEAVLDLDRFTRLLALDILAWNGDGYAFHANNYRVFFDRSQERLVFMPHGMDQTFVLPDAPVLAGGDGMVANAVLSLPQGRQQVLAWIREFRGSFFQPDTIRRRVAELAVPLASTFARWTNAFEVVSPAEHAQSVGDWLQRMSDRLASIDAQLSGITNLSMVRTGQSLALTAWSGRTNGGAPIFLQPTNPVTLSIRAEAGGNGAWVTTLWLEGGRYQVQGQIRATPVSAGTTNLIVAGLRVRAPRKRSLGPDWGWDGRRRVEYRPGGENGNLTFQPLPAAAGTNWTNVVCEFDLRQPAADLEISCEASGAGEAWFDPATLKLTRLSDPGR